MVRRVSTVEAGPRFDLAAMPDELLRFRLADWLPLVELPLPGALPPELNDVWSSLHAEQLFDHARVAWLRANCPGGRAERRATDQAIADERRRRFPGGAADDPRSDPRDLLRTALS